VCGENASAKAALKSFIDILVGEETLKKIFLSKRQRLQDWVQIIREKMSNYPLRNIS